MFFVFFLASSAFVRFNPVTLKCLHDRILIRLFLVHVAAATEHSITIFKAISPSWYREAKIEVHKEKLTISMHILCPQDSQTRR